MSKNRIFRQINIAQSYEAQLDNACSEAYFIGILKRMGFDDKALDAYEEKVRREAEHCRRLIK